MIWDRLEMANQALANKVLTGNTFAVKEWRENLEQQAKLYGVHAPTKIAATTPDGEHYAPLAFDISKLSNEELLALRKLRMLKSLPQSTREPEPEPAIDAEVVSAKKL
jgi:hypothetical protein